MCKNEEEKLRQEAWIKHLKEKEASLQEMIDAGIYNIAFVPLQDELYAVRKELAKFIDEED